MKRKVNLVGVNTLTISLPTKWAKDNNVNKGDELDYTEEKGSLIFSKNGFQNCKKTIELNIDDYTYLSFSRLIGILYKNYYDKIIFIHEKSYMSNLKTGEKVPINKMIKKFVDRYIGAEIISQTPTRTEIECFISEDNLDLEKIEWRIYFLLKEMVQQLLDATKGDFHKYHEIVYDHHDNIAKFINYYLRNLNNSVKTEDEKKMLYSYYCLLDTLVDKIRHLSEKIDEFGCTEKTKSYITSIFTLFESLFNAVLSKKEMPHKLIDERYALKKKIDKEKFTISEYRVIAEIYFFLDTFNEAFDCIIIKNITHKEFI